MIKILTKSIYKKAVYRKAKRTLLMLLFAIAFFKFSLAQHHTGSWGDQGNGTYINPILNADYSDPDVIRVGEKYYMVCSEFHYMGMPVLESEDMVNWKIIGQVYHKLDFPKYEDNTGYAQGSWAPAIRYHDNKFWVFFCTPSEGLFMSTAENPGGNWTSLVHVKNIENWEDPCPFWDENGQAYLGHSVLGAGPIIIHKMSADGTKLLDNGLTVYTGPVAEGTKIYKLNGYYYISIPEGGVEVGWQTVLRSKNIYGPYEKKVVLEKGSTPTNGPHQGALVETPNGEWWFYHFQSSGALGRVVHLQPVSWQDGWPVIGVDIDRNGIGEPIYVWKKPNVGKSFTITAPQTDDDFNTSQLGLQWQFNHNPVNEAWSLTTNPGWLTLKALKAESFMKAKNTFTQKVMGTTGEATAELDISKMVEGQKAGICSMSNLYNLLGVYKKKEGTFVYINKNGQAADETPIKAKKVFLKVKLDLINNNNQFFYSLDNKTYLPFGKPFEAKFGFWKGTRIGLYNFNEIANDGIASFNCFNYDYDGPK